MSNPRRRTIAIVAMDPNRVIGRDGNLPWRLPEDLKFFKRTTMGHAILMGRKTWDSIGRPLPGRRNIVLSRTLESPPAEEVDLIRSVAELETLDLETDLYVIGGAEVYAALLPRCDEILLSQVRAPHEGDTFFPTFEDAFELAGVVETFEAFEVRRYVRIARD